MAEVEDRQVTPLWPTLPVCEPSQVLDESQGAAWLPLVFTVLDEPVSFYLRRVQMPVPQDACCLSLVSGSAQGSLAVDARWLDERCRSAGLVRPDSLAWNQVPAALSCGLLSWLLMPLLQSLKVACGQVFRLGPPEKTGPNSGRVALMPEGEAGGEREVMWLDLPETLLKRLPREQRDPAIWQGVPVMVSMQVGNQMLSLAQLASLRTGDIVLLNRPSAGRVLVVDARLRADVREQGDDYVLDSDWYIDERNEVSMEEITNDTESLPSVVLDQLTVPLVCEVGRLALSMAQLQALKPGAVLPMHRREDQAVDLLINGQKVGQGELVRLDGALGVRVVRLADAHR